MTLDRESFGPWLQHERERRQVTLDDIASRTKISRSLFAKLERGDVRDWPSGIFRRAFFREYAGAIGLDADAVLKEFLALFPDPADPAAVPTSPARAAASAESDLRLTLDDAPPPSRVSPARLRRALVDTAIIVGSSAAVAIVVGHPGAVLAIVALSYHAVAIVYGGMTFPVGLAPAARVTEPAPAVPMRQPRSRTEPRRADAGRRPAPRGRRRPADGSRGSRALN